MRGNTVGSTQESFEPLSLGLAELLHVVAGLAAAQQRANANHQDVEKFMMSGSVRAGIMQGFEIFNQTDRWMLCVPHPFLISVTT